MIKNHESKRVLIGPLSVHSRQSILDLIAEFLIIITERIGPKTRTIALIKYISENTNLSCGNAVKKCFLEFLDISCR